MKAATTGPGSPGPFPQYPVWVNLDSDIWLDLLDLGVFGSFDWAMTRDGWASSNVVPWVRPESLTD